MYTMTVTTRSAWVSSPMADTDQQVTDEQVADYDNGAQSVAPAPPMTDDERDYYNGAQSMNWHTGPDGLMTTAPGPIKTKDAAPAPDTTYVNPSPYIYKRPEMPDTVGPVTDPEWWEEQKRRKEAIESCEQNPVTAEMCLRVQGLAQRPGGGDDPPEREYETNSTAPPPTNGAQY